MSTSVLEALPGKLDIKRHSPSILYLSEDDFSVTLLDCSGQLIFLGVKPFDKFYIEIHIFTGILY